MWDASLRHKDGSLVGGHNAIAPWRYLSPAKAAADSSAPEEAHNSQSTDSDVEDSSGIGDGEEEDGQDGVDGEEEGGQHRRCACEACCKLTRQLEKLAVEKGYA